MAKAIALTPKPADPREELQRKIAAAPVEHAAAVLSAYALLEELHQRNILDTVRGLIGAGDHIVEQLANAMNSEKSLAAMRNLISLSKLLADVDPEVLHKVSEAFAQSASSVAEVSKQKEPPSLWTILMRMRTKESRRVLGIATAALTAAGKSLEPNKSSE